MGSGKNLVDWLVEYVRIQLMYFAPYDNMVLLGSARALELYPNIQRKQCVCNAVRFNTWFNIEFYMVAEHCQQDISKQDNTTA